MVGQAVHESAPEAFNCVSDDVKLVRGRALPKGPVYERTYIDDHLVFAVVPNQSLRSPEGPDHDLIRQGHLAYNHFKFERAPEKGFGISRPTPKGEEPQADLKFLAWGIEVDNHKKTVGAPLLSACIYLPRPAFCWTCPSSTRI